MLTLHHASKTFRDDLAAFCRSATVPREISDAVAAILADVRARGDEAVSYYAAKFDGAKLRARDFRVPAADLAGAAKKITPAELRALQAAHESILAYNKRGLPEDWSAKNKHGALVGALDTDSDPVALVELAIATLVVALALIKAGDVRAVDLVERAPDLIARRRINTDHGAVANERLARKTDPVAIELGRRNELRAGATQLHLQQVKIRPVRKVIHVRRISASPASSSDSGGDALANRPGCGRVLTTTPAKPVSASR